MAAWQDSYWWSKDGLRLHYRDYPGRDDRPPILCLPGLTRNARDFATTADRLAGEWRLLCVDLRGRGESAYAKDAMTYVPLVYLQDIEELIATLGLSSVVVFGTSLGGLLAMLLSTAGHARIAGALLNDIGPVLDPVGLARIQAYVGRGQSWPTWLHVARSLAVSHGAIHPDFQLADWIALAKRLCRLTPAGRIVQDYDPRIAEPLRLSAGGDEGGGLDMWPAFERLGEAPLTVLRGELSDLFGPAAAGAMQARVPGLDLVTVPRVGHAPTLDEPESIAAIDRLLARIG
ncbi:MAG TPA: alpha/beta hydrolase [Sphingomonadaceae bacterium]|nr:alpha/beta hydrolase [Sphingomonadaceae bacterium]